MGAEEVGFSKRGKNRKERLGTTDFLFEEFKCVRQGVADRPAQFAESKGVEEHVHLMTHANGAVLKVPIVKTHARINEQAGGPERGGAIGLSAEVIFHATDDRAAEIEVRNLADIFAFDVAEDHCRLEIRSQFEPIIGQLGAGDVQDFGTRFETGAGNVEVVGFNGDNSPPGSEGFDDGEEF